MKSFDSLLIWVILLAIVTVVVASGQTDTLIQSIQKLLSSLISVITSPQTGSKQ